MIKKFAPEALCEDCPMRHFAGTDNTVLVDQNRLNPEDQADRNLVDKLPNGQLLLTAISLSRPERCEAIREALPKVRETTARWVSTTACAEVYAISQAYQHENVGLE